MKSLIIMLIVFSMISCKRRTTSIGDYPVVTHEGCEYFLNSYGPGISHKGNCSNPIHQCR